jgi:DNA topoisomerase-2
MDAIKVTIDRDEGSISCYNSGRGIPVEMHSKEKIYIPELIFGHLLSGSNYDDDEKKVTGGRNGYGAKLANIYSLEFTLETADKKNGKKYKQTWTKNMGEMGKAKITDNKKGEEWTKITFRPDFKRFGMPDGLDDDIEALLKKRVYDMAGTLAGIKVELNGEKLKIKNFKQYVEMYTKAVNEVAATKKKGKGKGKAKEDNESREGSEVPVGASPGGTLAADGSAKVPIIYERFGDRWEVAFAPSEGQFQQVSFVNAIATSKGGTHVDYISKQIVDGIIEGISKKAKKAVTTLKPFTVKSHLWVFINCLIENPQFDSQTKENMTLQAKKFGSKCTVGEAFLKKGKSSVRHDV